MKRLDSWHPPVGFRIVTTDERVYIDRDTFLSRTMANRAADDRNRARAVPMIEWRVEKVGRRFRLVALRNELECVGESIAA